VEATTHTPSYSDPKKHPISVHFSFSSNTGLSNNLLVSVEVTSIPCRTCECLHSSPWWMIKYLSSARTARFPSSKLNGCRWYAGGIGLLTLDEEDAGEGAASPESTIVWETQRLWLVLKSSAEATMLEVWGRSAGFYRASPREPLGESYIPSSEADRALGGAAMNATLSAFVGIWQPTSCLACQSQTAR
jgi:hypothetical protein